MRTNQERTVQDGIDTLVHAAGTNSRDHGFHDDWPVDIDLINPGRDRDLQKAIVEKLALVHEEISESLGEIRSGHEATEVYYTRTTKDMFGEVVAKFEEQAWDSEGKPELKPEGFGIELADAVIRIADLAYLTGINLGPLITEKMAYNATRAHKHGRAF